MTEEFDKHQQLQVEEYLGRELSADELVTVPSVAKLTAAQQAVIRSLAPKHRLVCMLYVRGVVQGIRIRDALEFVDAVRGPHL